MKQFLTGDIGGTKTRLVVFSDTQGADAPLIARTFASRDYPSLEAILDEFRRDQNGSFFQAVFGVAGPVIAGRAEVTNLPWVIDVAMLRRHLDVESITLMNDLQATAYALPFLKGSDLLTLNTGTPAAEGARAVIAVGTGLGEAFLLSRQGQVSAWPSEGGHVSFAPCNDRQLQLLQCLLQEFEHVSYERVCSGIGIPNLYHFVSQRADSGALEAVAARVAAAADATPIIVAAAQDASPGCPACRQAIEMFVEILGAAAANLALKVFATAGVYIGGGIPPRLNGFFQTEHFMRAFTAKGRMAELLTRIPVHVIQKPEAAIFGAACYALHINPDREKG